MTKMRVWLATSSHTNHSEGHAVPPPPPLLPSLEACASAPWAELPGGAGSCRGPCGFGAEVGQPGGVGSDQGALGAA